MPPPASLTLGRMTSEDGSSMENSSNNNSLHGSSGVEDGVREQDRLMPIANVIRIMRRVLPSHAKISDDAKETIQECVSEFISFVTSEANERCQKEQRKTITAEDVLWAMNKLGFDSYMPPLTLYLQRYRDIEGDHRPSLSKKDSHHSHYYMTSLPNFDPYSHFK